MSGEQPTLPLEAVSSHCFTKQNGLVVIVTEVVFVIDASGRLWRREGTKPWALVLS